VAWRVALRGKLGGLGSRADTCLPSRRPCAALLHNWHAASHAAWHAQQRIASHSHGVRQQPRYSRRTATRSPGLGPTAAALCLRQRPRCMHAGAQAVHYRRRVWQPRTHGLSSVYVCRHARTRTDGGVYTTSCPHKIPGSRPGGPHVLASVCYTRAIRASIRARGLARGRGGLGARAEAWQCPHWGALRGARQALPCAHRSAYALMGSNAKLSAAGVGPGVPLCGHPSVNEVPQEKGSCTAHAAIHEPPLQSRAGTATWLPAHVLGLPIWRSCVRSTTVLRNRAWMPKLDFGVRGRFLRAPRHTAVLHNNTITPVWWDVRGAQRGCYRMRVPTASLF
jgi:hypothetical protein